MDFFTFVIIASFIYSIFVKKDKPPQRRPGSPEDNRIPPRAPAENQGKNKGNILENLEKQLKDTAKKFEQELQEGRTVPTRPRTVRTSRPKQQYRPLGDTQGTEVYQGNEGAWGTEGRSEYDRYAGKQETQGTEGVQGQEGVYGQEGTFGSEGAWGTEGSWGPEGNQYAQRQKEAANPIEQSSIGASPIYFQEGKVASLGFSSSEVVQGVIWAEVLREPRGKRALSRRF